MNDYPQLWKRGLIQTRIRELANHQCEECGIRFKQGTNIAISAVRKDGKPMVGGVHHIDGNPQNCTTANLVYLCQRCHCRVQWSWVPGQVLPKMWYNTPPRWIVNRGLPFSPNPQPPLFEVQS